MVVKYARRAKVFLVTNCVLARDHGGCEDLPVPGKDAVMSHSTPLDSWLATPFAHELLPVVEVLLPTLRRLAAVLQAYRREATTPQATWELENDLRTLLREGGRRRRRGRVRPPR